MLVDGQTVEIDASDVPNNPIQDFITALEDIARGREAFVWWHLEPAGYFMYFCPVHEGVQVRIEFHGHSERAQGKEVATIQGSSKEILMPFWRFLREFQSHSFTEPDWPDVDYDRIQEIKRMLDGPRPT